MTYKEILYPKKSPNNWKRDLEFMMAERSDRNQIFVSLLHILVLRKAIIQLKVYKQKDNLNKTD